MKKFFPEKSNTWYAKSNLSAKSAKKTSYYLWWRYLRLSEDYWWICQQKGQTLDKEFAKTYRLFGDIFNLSFEKWWASHGANAFAYKANPPKVEVVKLEDINEIRSEDWSKLIKVPLHLTKSEMLAQMSALFDKHVPKPLPPHLIPENEVENLRGIRLDVLLDAHRVWCLNDAIRHGKLSGKLDRPERLTQYWIGIQLGLEPESDRAKVNRYLQASKYESATVRVKINRYISKARNIIANVELGRFPVMTPVPSRKRWSEQQLAEKAKAISAGLWICPESITREIQALLPIKSKPVNLMMPVP
jgi:hypothetical protein